jgi:PTH1 family peptidyl-tRNA hydrolase
MQKEKISLDKVLVLVDDIALPFGTIRVRGKGSDAGHNGLKHINQVLGTNAYARVRFGIGDEFSRGQQIDYVLGEWSPEEEKLLPERIEQCIKIIQSFGTIGLDRTMNQFNNK